MKTLVTSLICVLAIVARIEATETVETPLVVNQLNGTLQVIINPSLGTASLYSVQGNIQVLYASMNFLTDVNYLQALLVPAPPPDNRLFNRLQLGSPNNKPSSAELLRQLPKVASKAEQAANMLPMQQRAVNGDMEFWSDPPEYDGVVRGALSNRILVILIPVKRTMLFYEISNNKFALKGWRTYSSELYVPQVIESTPTPEDINRQLPPEVKKEHQKAIEAALEAAGAGAAKAITLSKSDAWVAAGTLDRFVVLDSANHHIMTYDFSGKDLVLKSVRNLEVDLMIPSAFHSDPDPRKIFEELLKDKTRQKFLLENGYIDAAAPRADLALLQAIVGSSKTSGSGSSAIQANILNDDITLDFTKSQKIMVYRLAGANNMLELVSSRDYTIDASVSILDSEIKNRFNGAQLFKEVQSQANKNNDAAAMRILKSAVSFDPGVYKDAEGDKNVSRALSKLPEWQPLIEAAQKDFEAQQAAIEQRKKAAAEERERRKNLREEVKKDNAGK